MASVRWDFGGVRGRGTHILMLEVLKQLEFSVCALRKHRRAEGLHDLLDGHRLSGELVLGRAVPGIRTLFLHKPDVCTYHTRPKAPMPTGWSSAYLDYQD